MDYITFERYIKGLMEDWDWMDKCYEIGFDTMSHSHGLDYSIFLMEKIFNDENKWLSWWAFEKNFGRDNKYETYDKDGSVIPTTTIQDIYNLLTEGKDV